MMSRFAKILSAAAILSVTAMTTGLVLAAQPASKATAKVGQISVLGMETTASDWMTILSNSIKTPNGKDLFIDVSLECGLYTQTKVDSMAGDADESIAEAEVLVRVLVDGEEALPGPVVFCKRSQTLAAEFQGLLTDEEGNVCLDLVFDEFGDPIGVTIDEDCLRPETVELILKTMTANAFNFVQPDLTSGVHTVEVQAKVDTSKLSTLYSGAKVRDKFDKVGEEDPYDNGDGEWFMAGDEVLTLDKDNKLEVGQTIVINDEQMLVESINPEFPKNHRVVRAINGTLEADHPKDTQVFIVAGADAYASLGKGSMTVELVRMIQDEDIILEDPSDGGGGGQGNSETSEESADAPLSGRRTLSRR